jgi:hypothetical protein
VHFTFGKKNKKKPFALGSTHARKKTRKKCQSSEWHSLEIFFPQLEFFLLSLRTKN